MRIKKIEIDGFKSYSQRQVIDCLDAQFNAITGLNGSGKSNILDAICFLLGITNLQQVRASNLAELVYKQGQAGITRATVTITFDNTDPHHKPTYYEQTNEIVIRRTTVINGRNTYQINGMLATNARVADLFKSVQMNVNNPHFLIMQGRVTKVLNMKPIEILAMLEEAAGVRMYEQKKQGAIRTIDRKQGKVEEIKKLMDEDILPRVEKLKKDRDRYLEFQRIGRDIEGMERKLVAFEYYASERQTKEKERESVRMHQQQQIALNEARDLDAQVDIEKKELTEMERAKSSSMSEEKTALENELKHLQTEQAKLESGKDDKASAKEDLQREIERRTRELNSERQSLDKLRAQLTRKEQESGGAGDRKKEAEEKLIRARAQLDALRMGMMANEEGRAVTLESQLTATRTQLNQLETNMKLAQQKVEQVRPRLVKKQAELAGTSRRSDADEHKRQRLLVEIERVRGELAEITYDEQAEMRLEGQQNALRGEKQQVDENIQRFESTYPALNIKYTNPVPNFDRSKVKGAVGTLFRVKDMKYATALEVVAGAKLYNFIVDTADTATSLLDKGQLARRITFLPLNKISGRNIDQRVLAEARRSEGMDNVHLAKDLIEYSPEYESAMSHIFGSTLVCTSSDMAKKLTFNNRIGCRTVTLSGDDYKSQGIITGGSRPNRTPVLEDIGNIQESYERRTHLEDRLRAIRAEVEFLRPLRERYEESSGKLRSFESQLEMVSENLKNSAYNMLQEEVVELERELTECDATITSTEPQIRETRKKCSELEERKKNEKSYQEKEKKRAEKEAAEAQRVLDSLAKSDVQEELATLRANIEHHETEIKNCETANRERVEQLNSLETELELATREAGDAQKQVKQAQQSLDNYNKQFRSHDKAIREKANKIEELKRRARQLGSDSEELKKQAEKASEDSKNCASRIRKLEKSNPWIADDKHHFGEVGTHYDFSNYTYDVGKQQIEKSRDRLKELENMINVHAMDLLGTAEQQCNELTGKREQLERDKEQLNDAIKKLDEKKKTELLAAHKKISDDFDQIFSTLLPGTNAKLVPTGNSSEEEGLEGLEVKIAFNKKWKESLGELSGGQRSLVALSLILAMLKFKPAPIYILDEVDAALDMSHTQNIGTMIKKHFKESQFIIVSLKEGMFNNANVLYRTKFADGTSTVTRIDNRSIEE